MTSKDILCFIIILFINCSNYLIRCTVIDESIHLSDNSCSAAKKGCSGDASFAEAFKYLQRWGYISEEKAIDEITKSQFTDALMGFQDFMSIETNGVLDEFVIQVLKGERCSVPDTPHHSRDKTRTKRSLSGKKWMPYSVSVPELPLNWLAEGEVGAAYSPLIEEAAKVWMDFADVKIRRLSSPEVSYYHNIIFTFNETAQNPSINLAFDIGLSYTYTEVSRKTNFKIASNLNYPAFDVKVWSSVPRDKITSPEKKSQIIYVLVHIWGHLLGLGHTTDTPNSVMNPDFSLALKSPDYSLKGRDVSEILTLYGTAPNMNESQADSLHVDKRRPDWSRNATDLCEDPKIDSILEMPDGMWIVFRGPHYYEIGPTGMSLRSPRRIAWDFSPFNGPVDASFSWNDMVFLFRQNEYFKFRGNTFIAKRKISDGFKGVPDGPFDDIFVWNFNQKTYFFKGGEFWKYDSIKREVPTGYPKLVSAHWKGMPNRFDAAISSRLRNQTYFFNIKQFYRFDDISRKAVDDSNPPYPRKTDIWFFKCRNKANVPQILLLNGEHQSTTTPTPSFDNEPEFSAGSYNPSRIDDDLDYWEGQLGAYLIVGILVILIVGGISTYLYVTHLKNESGTPETHETTDGPPRPSPQTKGPVSKPIPEETASSGGATTSRHRSAAAPASGRGQGEDVQTTRL